MTFSPYAGIDLPADILNPLKREGIENQGTLVLMTAPDLLDIRVIGEKRVRAIECYLNSIERGLRKPTQALRQLAEEIFGSSDNIPIGFFHAVRAITWQDFLVARDQLHIATLGDARTRDDVPPSLMAFAKKHNL